MRILKLCVRFPPAPGGVEFQMLKICKELKKRGHDVQVFASDLYSEIPWKKLDKRYTNIEGIPVKRFKAYSLKGDMQYSVIPSMMRTIFKGKWDIIHAHSYGYFPSHVGAWASRAKRGKFIFTPHFHPGETTWGGKRRMKIRSLYDRYLAEGVMEKACKIICVSKGERKLLIDAGITPEKIVIVPDSVDILRFEGLREGSFKKTYDIKDDFVLFVGRLAKNKGLEYLIEAMPEVLRSFPQTKFVLIGEDEGMYKKLMGRAKVLGIEHSVLFTGSLNDKSVSQAFIDCDIFVLPSEFEAFGIVLIEAMAAKKPCVATKVGGMPYVVKDGETGILVDYGDSHQLGTAICELLGDEAKRAAFGSAGRQLALKNFAIEKVVDRLENVYREVADTR
ncbi:MAG: glycosyltransferase family 4 protein [Methanomassiliicoccales archaeon]|nr:MAG: glycosyltransferase family 4 protein [Methanomassiliicoccales archaeon]